VIDILRATSAICTAIHYGVEKIIPVSTIEEARQYQTKGFIAAAERNGEVPEGFSFGNSPFSYMNEQIKGKSLVLTTTNGTQAIAVAADSFKVVIGSFLNKDVLAKWLLQQGKDLIFLCAGWKDKFNLEDSIFAGALTKTLLAYSGFHTICDSALAAQYLYEKAEPDIYGFLKNSSHYKRLEKLELDADIVYCLSPNLAPVIPILENGALIRFLEV
jgi:2-phosphosulfolactate phosphatase